MRRQDYNKRRANNDNRTSKNFFGQQHGLLNMQPGLLGSQTSLMGGPAGLMGSQSGIMAQNSLLGSQNGLFNAQGGLLGNPGGLFGSRGDGIIGGGPASLMGNQAGLLRNQLGMLDNPDMMGMVGQDLLSNSNLLSMLANRNINSLMGSQLNGVGQGFNALQASMAFGGKQSDAVTSLLGDPVGGYDRMRSREWMGGTPGQAGILGPAPDTKRVMPLLSADDASLGMGMGGNMLSRNLSFDEDSGPPKKRFQHGKHLLSSPSFSGGNSNRSGPSKGNVCPICTWTISTTFLEHVETLDHKKRVRLINKGCILCKTGKFKNYSDYVKHLDSPKHKQNKIELNRSLEAKRKAEEMAKGEKQKKGTTDAEISEKVSLKHESGDERFHMVDEDIGMEDVTERDGDSSYKADSLVYDPNVPVGQEHVISVTGFFCKLCRKFYNNETQAKVNHCKAEVHFLKYQDSLRSK